MSATPRFLVLATVFGLAGPAWAGGGGSTPKAPAVKEPGAKAPGAKEPGAKEPGASVGPSSGGPAGPEARTAPEPSAPAGPATGPTAGEAAPTGMSELDAAALPGLYVLVGTRGEAASNARLSIERGPRDTYRVVRRARVAGRETTLEGVGTLRRGLLLVEFDRTSARPTAAAPGATTAPAGAPAGGTSKGLAGSLPLGEEPDRAASARPAPASTAAAAPVASASAPRLAIQGSVGAGGRNDPADVRVIQEALRARGYLTEGSYAPGLSDGVLVLAIRRYQKERAGFRWPDGRVDPDNRTIRQMNREEAAARGETPAAEPAPAGPALPPPDVSEELTARQLADALSDVDPDAAVAVYGFRGARILGACRDVAAGGREWTIERGLRAGDAAPAPGAAPGGEAPAVEGPTGPSTPLPDERDAAQGDIRRRIAEVAARHVGLGWAFPERRQAYADLLFPHDTPADRRAFAQHMSSCGLFAMAVLRGVGKRHASLDGPYAAQIGQAIANVVRIGRSEGGWHWTRSGGELRAAPEIRQGDMVLIGGSPQSAWGGTEHMLVVTRVERAQVQGREVVVLCSVDGGQPHIAARRRLLERRGGELWLRSIEAPASLERPGAGRRVQGFFDVGTLRLDR